MSEIVRGSLISFEADPFEEGASSALRYVEDGALFLENGRIVDVGDAEAIIAAHPDVAATTYTDCLIAPGFIDCHVHYPQLDIIGANNSGLIDWLDRYAFPQESLFEDPALCRQTANVFLSELFKHGVTTASVYCTVHKASADAFFETTHAANALMIAGKVCMDRGAPAALLDDPQSACDDSKALIQKWHGRGRCRYAITPRFAITSSPDQLSQLGDLWSEHPDVHMQTHLSEMPAEIEEVARLYPQAKDYYNVYEEAGLVGDGGLFGHCVHLTDRERKSLEERGDVIVHCPTSNEFLGSGVFNLKKSKESAPGLAVSLASDIGGGTSLSPFTTMQAAYKAARHHGHHLTPTELFYLSTAGGAASLGLEGQVGNLKAGSDADFIICDLKATPLLSRMTGRARSVEDILMALIMLADDRAIRATYIAGSPIYERD